MIFGILAWHDYRHNVLLLGKNHCKLCGVDLDK